jgi:GTP cyclohydrolase I
MSNEEMRDDDAPLTNKQIMALTSKEEIMQALEQRFPGGMTSVQTQMRLIGEDITREGLVDTPYRVVKSWLELYEGYTQDPKKILGTVFEDDIGDQSDEIIICKDISFASHCEHHMIPFTGKVHIGYLPEKRVVGLSKLARLVEVFAHRMQIQEKLCSQIADTLMDELQPQGVGVIVEAKHMCMSARGAKNHSSVMVTSAMRGKFKTQNQTRNEFLSLIR